MNIELLKIYTLNSSGTGYEPMLVDGEPVEMVEYSYVSSRMGASELTATVRHHRCLDEYWTGREFVFFDNPPYGGGEAFLVDADNLFLLDSQGKYLTVGGSHERFFLPHIPSSSKGSEDERYVHTLEFRSARDMLLSGVYYCDAVAAGAASEGKPVSNSYDVRFFGTLDEFVQRFNDVLSYLGLSESLSVSLEGPVAGTTESREFTGDKLTLAEALSKAVDVWEVPFYFVPGGAVFGSADDEPLLEVEYGPEDELLGVSMNSRGEKTVTRIIAQGGTQNVPYYYPNPSPKGTLGTAGTAAGVSIVNPALFSMMVGQGDTLTYMGKGASRRSITLNIGGNPVTSAVSPSVQVTGLELLSGTEYPMWVKVSSDLSGGYDRTLSLRFSSRFGDPDGSSFPESEKLYWFTGRTAHAGTHGTGYVYHYVTRTRGQLQDGAWDVLVDRVNVISGGLTIADVPWEGIYENVRPDANDASGVLFPSRRLIGITVDFARILELPQAAGIDLSDVSLSVIGRMRSQVNWESFPEGVLPEDGEYTGNDLTGWTTPAGFYLAWFQAEAAYEPAGWYLGDEPVSSLADVGLAVSSSPSVGDTIIQTVLSYVTPTGRLMPRCYRQSGGTVRGYIATNDPPEDDTDIYTDPDTGETYTFLNEYDPRNPHEHIETFDDVFPTIANLKDRQGNPLNVLAGVYFDDGYNIRDLLEDGSTLKYDHFFVKLLPLGFNIFDCAIEDGEMAIVMSEGPCAGCHFKVLVTSDGQNPVQADASGNLVTDGGGKGVIDPDNIIPEQNDTSSSSVWLALALDVDTFGGTEVAAGVMPAFDKNSGAGPKPSAGDAFTLENILLPQAYFTAAEEELARRMIAFMAENNADKFDPAVTFSRVFLAENPDIRAGLSARSRLSLTYDGRTYAPLYVSQITITVREGETLPEISVETKDVIEKGSAGIDEKIAVAVGDAVRIVRAASSGDIPREADGRYLRKDEPDTATHTVTFKDGAQFGDYKAGMGGNGGAIYTNEQGRSIAEFDFLNIRRKATFSEIEVDSIRKVGGSILLSLADIRISAVQEVDGGWKCFFGTESGEGSSVDNRFIAGDQAICQTFGSTGARRYWRLVTETGADYIVLSETDCEAGSDIPEVGDTVIQLGHRTDPARQSAQILSCYGENTPSYMAYAEIDGYTLEGKEVYGFHLRRIPAEDGQPASYEPLFFCYGSMYLGSPSSHIVFDRTAGRFYLVGALSQSPAGDSFPMPVFRGIYDSSQTYYRGDLVTYDGETWLYLNELPSVGTAPSEGIYWTRWSAKGAGGAFKSTAFRRSNTQPAKPSGGSYENPLPTTSGWSDGIPSGEQILWASNCTFYSDGASSGWSTPRQMTDTQTFDVEFAKKQAGDATPPAPTDANRHGGSGPQVWFDPNQDPSEDFTQMYWRAERTKENGVWGSWTIVRIKGEKGDDGTSPILALLDNEMDGIALGGNSRVAPAGGLSFSTNAAMYYGTTPLALTALSVSGAPSGWTVTTNPATGAVNIAIAAGTTLSERTELTISMSAALASVTYTRDVKYTLAVAVSGKDGKDGEDGQPGATGPQGNPGNDAVAYKLVASTAVVHKSGSTYDPLTVNCIRRVAIGSEISNSGYGAFYYSADGGSEVSYSNGQSLRAGTVFREKLTFNWYTSSSKATLIDTVTVFVVEDGEDGQQGPPGSVEYYAGKFSTTKSYYGQSDRRAVVVSEGSSGNPVFYKAKATCPRSPFSGIALSNTSYWELYGGNFEALATGLAFASHAFIENASIGELQTYTEDPETDKSSITAKGKTLTMIDEDGNVRLLITGGTVSGGGAAPSDRPIARMMELSRITFTPAEINAGASDSDSVVLASYGASEITTEANAVILPPLPINLYVNSISSGNFNINITSQYTLDGVPIGTRANSSASMSAGSGAASITHSLPAMNITVKPNVAHKIGLVTTMEVNGDYNGNNITFSSYMYANAAQQIVVKFGDERVEIAANGFRVAFGSDYEFIAQRAGSADSTIEFSMRAGNAAIKVQNYRVLIMIAGVWYNITRNSSGYLVANAT